MQPWTTKQLQGFSVDALLCALSAKCKDPRAHNFVALLKQAAGERPQNLTTTLEEQHLQSALAILTNKKTAMERAVAAVADTEK